MGWAFKPHYYGTHRSLKLEADTVCGVALLRSILCVRRCLVELFVSGFLLVNLDFSGFWLILGGFYFLCGNFGP